jgi:hypothetical protein
MPRPSRDLKVVIVPPEGGYDEERLLRALEMLVTEKDFIDYFRRLSQNTPGDNPGGAPPPKTPPSHNP